MIKSIKFLILFLSAISICACGGNSSSSSSALTLPSSLELAEPVQSLIDNIGSGQYEDAISSHATAGYDVLNLTDQFFEVFGEVELQTSSTTAEESTSKGIMKIDFSTLETISADINMDGTKETITCSQSATPPLCAYIWMDSEQFALLVVTEAAGDTDLGKGMVIFHPSLIGTADSGLSISTTWEGTTGDDGTRTALSYFTGALDSDTDAETGVTDVGFDQGTITFKESATWSEQSMSCEASQMAMRWLQTGNYLSSYFTRDDICNVPIGGTCIEISTGDTSPNIDRCSSLTIVVSSLISAPETASDAEFSWNFPSEPTF